MKTSIGILACAWFLAMPVLAAETVNIKSSTPFVVVNGQFTYPQDSVYTITLTEKNVLLQGKVYLPAEKPLMPMPKPNREKSFFDWAIRTPADSAQALIDAGGTVEAARQLMADFYRPFAKSDTFSVNLKDDCYRLVYRGVESYVSVPCKKREPKPDYQENVLKPGFEDLCHYLRVGDLILKGEDYRQVISASELSSQFLKQLKDIPNRATKNPCGDYQSVTLTRNTRILPSAIDDIVKANK